MTPTYPGVYIQELTSPVHPITGVATSIAAFVGYTARGIDNRAQVIYSASDYQRLYGGLASNSEVSYAVQQFFANGGNQAYVVRTPSISTGAAAAQVVFNSLTFQALSSGGWANGNLLIDVDFAGIAKPVSGTVTIAIVAGVATVTGTGTFFTAVLKVGQYLIFASDPSGAAYQIATIGGDTTLTLGSDPPAAALGTSTTAVAIADQTAFNLTVSNLADGTVESFPNVSLNSNLNNYIANMVNDLDNGSQLVNVTVAFPAPTAAPVASGIVGTIVSIAQLNYSLGASPLSAPVTVSAGSNQVTGTGFTPAMAGQSIVFASDPTKTLYAVSSVQSATSLTLASAVTGFTTSTSASSLTLGPATPLGPVNVTKGQTKVTGAGFVAALVGELLEFASDASDTPYRVATVQSPTVLLLTAAYGGATAATTASAFSVTATAPVAGTVILTGGSPTVDGAGFTVGEILTFAADATKTPYLVSALPPGGATLTQPFDGPVATPATISSGTSNGSNYGIQLGVSFPAAQPSPLPISIKVFPKNSPIPQTVSGLASQLQSAINSALTVQLPGASVVCSVSGIGSSQAIRVNALLPQIPDAVLQFQPPSAASGYTDASGPLFLGLNPPAVANVAHYAFGTGHGTTAATPWGGSQTTSNAGADGSGLPQTVDIIGDPGLFTGIYALNSSQNDAIFFNLLCIPEATRAVPGNPAALDSTVNPNAIFAAAVALCDLKRAMLLIDCPPYVNTVAAAVDWKTSGLTVVDPNGAAFFPRLRLPDPLNNYNLRTFAPCGVVAGLYAQTDSTRGVWKAPAGISATLNGVQSLVYKLSDLENGALNPLGLTCFRTFPVYGSVLWGARTLVGADALANQWKYVPVRRVALFIESSLYRGTQWVVFEPNDEPLWSAVRLNIGSFMQNLFTQGYFQGQTPSQAYFVKCDSETTTQTDIDNGVVNIVVGFAPLEPAEFVVIQIQQISGQTSN